jgi:N-acetylneuraminic acid mutarotase
MWALSDDDWSEKTHVNHPTAGAVLSSLNTLALCVFGEPAEGVDQLHLLDRVAASLKKTV